MRNMLRVRFILLTTCFGLFAALQAQGQMKIGNHPTQINKASILELESPNQALRLTRVDTANVNTIINALTPAEKDSTNGMIVFQPKDSSLYVRAAGWWHRLVSSSEVYKTFWNLNGNAGTDSSVNFLGTTDAEGLRIGTHNTPYIIISGTGRVQIVDSLEASGYAHFSGDSAVFDHTVNIHNALDVHNGNLTAGADSVHVGKHLFIQDSVTLRTVREALPEDNAVLVISSTGLVRKMSLNAIGIRKMAGLTGPEVYMKVDRDSTDFGMDSTTTPNTITFHMPYANGVAGAARNGLVDSTSQSFAGAKSFRNSIAVGTTDNPTSTFQVNGNVAMADTTTIANLDLSTHGNFRTVICDVSGLADGQGITVTLPAPIDGRIYTIKKIGKAGSNQILSAVEVKTSGGILIDRDTDTFTINNNWTSVTLQAQVNGAGSGWVIVR